MGRAEDHAVNEAPAAAEGKEDMNDEIAGNHVFVFPASFCQQRLWFLDRLEPGSPAYNISAAIRLRGDLDIGVLRDCLAAVVDRHESLRTGIAQVEGQPSQVVSEQVEFEVPVVELSGIPANDLEDEISQRAHAEAKTPFQLERGPLFRAQVLAVGEQDHVLLVTVHHIIADGWSMGVLYSEVSQLYEARAAGRELELPELPIQYVDYTVWQQEFVESDEVESQLEFWRSGFGGTLPVLELPKKTSRPAARSSAGAKEWISLDGKIVDACRALCRREQATPYQLFLAALKVLFFKYAGQDDIIIGSPIANRSRAETETSVGFYANTVAYRTDLSGDPSFRDVLQRVRDFSTQVYANQDVPFERVVEVLNPDRDLSHNPLFQAMFTMQPSPDEWLKLPGITAEFLEVDNETAKFDLLIELQDKPDGIQGYFEYSTEIFDQATIAQMVRHYYSLLEQLIHSPDTSIGAASILTRDERELLLETWNDTPADAPRESCVQNIFRKAASKFVGELAIVFGEERVSYAELDERSNRIARLLAARGVKRGDFVGVCFERSIEMVVAVVGALKAGAAYVPIDPGYPAERRAYLVEDSKIQVLLTNLEELTAPDGVPLERIGPSFDSLDAFAGDDPAVESSADDIAYVIYTSGSTGKPKGVTMRHGPLTNLVAWQLGQSVVGRGSRTLQFASLSFDVSFQELFATFASGGALQLVSDEVRKNPSELLRLLKRDSVERLFLPYIALQQIAEVGDLETIIPQGLREVVTAGEQLHVTPSIVRFFSRLDGCTLTNQYGPTESHVVTSYELEGLPHEWPGVPPIGKPIENARMYVLDRNLAPVPIGVTGELYIAGDVLASGYHDRPDLTAEKFVDDLFVETEGARMYPSGDLARYRADGEIEFLGRNDHQVKIRGYRVERDEVETALNGFAEVAEAFVVVEGEGSERRLVAYLVPAEGSEPTSETLGAALRVELPEYMIPSAFFALEKPPLTPSGKVARAALSKCPGVRPLGGSQEVVEARTDTERTLSAIWKGVLGNDSIGIRDNFFDLGGHSILAVRLMTRVQKELHVELPLATLFRAPTIEEMARFVESERAEEEETTEPGLRASDRVRAETSSLVLMHEGDGELPLFCVHGVGGNVLRFSDLVRGLGADQTCYGLQARGADGRSKPHECLREMAAAYVKEVEETFPSGPYLICGYSSGGVIAYEMAKQLRQAGRPVGLLTLFDTYHPEFYADDSDAILLRKRFREEGLWPSVKEFFRIFWRHQQQRVNNQKLRVYRKLGKRLPQSLIPHSLALAFYDAAKKYEAGDFSGEILLFRTTTNVGESGEDLGWGANAEGGARVVSIPGNHDNFLLAPHVGKICEALRPEIEKVRQRELQLDAPTP